MKPDQVTGAMVEKFETLADIGDGFSDEEKKEIIAAAYNAVVASDEPITAERLDTHYPKSELGPLWDVSLEGWIKLRVFGVDGQFSAMIIQKKTVIQVPTKTIGQLRALHAGLGIGEVCE